MAGWIQLILGPMFDTDLKVLFLLFTFVVVVLISCKFYAMTLSKINRLHNVIFFLRVIAQLWFEKKVSVAAILRYRKTL